MDPVSLWAVNLGGPGDGESPLRSVVAKRISAQAEESGDHCGQYSKDPRYAARALTSVHGRGRSEVLRTAPELRRPGQKR